MNKTLDLERYILSFDILSSKAKLGNLFFSGITDSFSCISKFGLTKKDVEKKLFEDWKILKQLVKSGSISCVIYQAGRIEALLFLLRKIQEED
jgi:hypothetical protein